MSNSWIVFSSGFTNVESSLPDPYPVCLTSSEDAATHIVGALQVVFPHLSHLISASPLSIEDNTEVSSQIERVIRGEVSQEHQRVVKTALDTLQRFPHI